MVPLAGGPRLLTGLDHAPDELHHIDRQGPAEDVEQPVEWHVIKSIA
jgi:hypothetical protein